MSATEAQPSTSKLPHALAALARYPQFIVWESRPNRKPNGKPSKIPLNKNLTGGNAHDPANWYSADQAFAMVDLCNQTVTPIQGGVKYGVGFVLTEDDPFFCLDIDHCLLSEDTRSPLALDLLARLPGAAVEVSFSGDGLHVWGTTTRRIEHKCKNTQLFIELYTDKRFIALGRPDDAVGDVLKDCTVPLSMLVGEYFPRTTAGTTNQQWTTEAAPGYRPLRDDDELIAKARDSKSGNATFGSKASFAQLWDADADALAQTYPSQWIDQPYDASSADAALAQHLAFWTGKNCERIRDLMEQSALTRDKWEREDYLERTILNAVALQTDIYTGKGRDGTESASPASTQGGVDATTADTGAGDNPAEWGETDLAKYLASRLNGLCCFTPPERCWRYRLKDEIWRDDGGAVYIRETIRNHLDVTKMRRGSNARGTLMLLESALATGDPWNRDPLLCGLPDFRVLDLRTQQARAATQADRISRRLGFVPESGPPLRWLQFLHETVDEKDAVPVIAFLQSWCAYLLTGYTRERKFLFLSGSGGNGKGVFTDVLAAVLKDYAVVLPADGLLGERQQHRQWIKQCDGARAAYITEVAPKARWNARDLKDLTGGGEISANLMRENSAPFQTTAKLIIAGNDLPDLQRVDPAIRDRLVLLSFNRRPARVDRHLIETLRGEGGRILSWMLAAMPGYLENGLADIPASADVFAREYFEDQDHFGRFIQDRFENDLGSRVSNKTLFAEMTLWAAEHNYTLQHKWTMHAITKEMKKRGYGTYRTANDRGTEGIRAIKPPPPPIKST